MYVHTRERGSSPGFDGVKIKFYYVLYYNLLRLLATKLQRGVITSMNVNVIMITVIIAITITNVIMITIIITITITVTFKNIY